MRIALAIAIFIILGIGISSLVIAADVSSSARFFIDQNQTIRSLGIGIIGGTMAETREAAVVLQVSNCTTFEGSTTCASIGGATINLTVIKPDGGMDFIANFTYDGNYLIRYDFPSTGNYTMNFSANHYAIGNNSLVMVFPILGYMTFDDSQVHKFENRTFFGGYNISYAEFNATVSKYINLSINNRDTNSSFNISLFLNASIPRSMMTFPDNSFFSPSTANIVAKLIDKEGKRDILTLNETNSSLAQIQEVVFVLNGTTITLNISMPNAIRDVGYISDHGLIVTPAFAAVNNISFYNQSLNFSSNGTGNQEILLYIGNKSEPSNITIDGNAILTNANWTFNSTARILTFNYSFSAHEFSVNFPTPTPQEEQPGPSPGPAPGGGGGGTSFTPPPSKPKLSFTADPPFLRASIHQDSVKTLRLVVHNTANEKQNFTVTTDSRELVTIPEEEFELGPNEIKRLAIEIFASESRLPDVYVRKIFVKGRDETKTVNVIIDVKPLKPLFDITIEVFPEYKTVEPNSTVLLRVKFTNLGTLKAATINYEITAMHLDSNLTVSRANESVFVETQLSAVNSLKIPAFAPDGAYVITMKAVVEGQTIVASDIINVRTQKAQALPDMMFFVWTLIIILAVTGSAVVVMHLMHAVEEIKARRKEKEQEKKVYVRTEGWAKPKPLTVKMRVVYRKPEDEEIDISDIAKAKGKARTSEEDITAMIRHRLKRMKRDFQHLDEGFREGVLDDIGYYRTKTRLALKIRKLKETLKKKPWEEKA